MNYIVNMVNIKKFKGNRWNLIENVLNSLYLILWFIWWVYFFLKIRLFLFLKYFMKKNYNRFDMYKFFM